MRKGPIIQKKILKIIKVVHRKEIQMANKHLKRCQTFFLTIKKHQGGSSAPFIRAHLPDLGEEISTLNLLCFLIDI